MTIHERRAIAPRQAFMPHSHLQAPEAAVDPELRGLGEFLAIEEIESKGDVDRHALARASQQAPHRLTERLALEIPQRHVDCRNSVRPIAGLTARQQRPIELVPDALMRERIIANDRRTGDLLDDISDHGLLRDGGEAVTDEPGIGLDLDQASAQRGRARGADHADVERNVNRRCGDACDFHGCCGPLRGRASWRAMGECAMQDATVPRLEIFPVRCITPSSWPYETAYPNGGPSRAAVQRPASPGVISNWMFRYYA